MIPQKGTGNHCNRHHPSYCSCVHAHTTIVFFILQTSSDYVNKKILFYGTRGQSILHLLPPVLGPSPTPDLIRPTHAPGAGKSSLLNRLFGKPFAAEMPPTDAVLEQPAEEEDVNFYRWRIRTVDMGSGAAPEARFRWDSAVQGNPDGIVIVMTMQDFSADESSRESLKDEIQGIQAVEAFRETPTLLWLNKADLFPEYSLGEITSRHSDEFGFNRRDWFLQPCNAVDGDGIMEGLDWLASRWKRAAIQAGMYEDSSSDSDDTPSSSSSSDDEE